MPADFYAFGEILWDCLPSGRHAGGAPFNVAVHLAQIGVSSALISCVGRDSLGDEILAIARDKNVNIDFVTRARIGLPTGTVRVTLDENGNPSYELAQPAAWDEICVSQEALGAVAESRAFIYGSLVARSAYNREQLERVLDLKGPIKCLDVNLRPPFAHASLVLDLARRADILKLNELELGQLVSAGEPLCSHDAIARACESLARATGVLRICVTRGAAGASLWLGGQLTSARAPQVEVRDTVGAGDAFTAGLIVGLTKGTDPCTVLEHACRLGAYVASRPGAIPVLPKELTEPIRQA